MDLQKIKTIQPKDEDQEPRSISFVLSVSILASLIVIILVGGIFYWIIRLETTQIDHRLDEIEARVDNEITEIKDNFSVIGDNANSDKYSQLIDNLLIISNYDFTIKEKDNEQYLYAIEKDTKKEKLLVYLGKNYQYIGRYNDLIILSQKTADCSELNQSLWIYDLEKKRLSQKAGVTTMGAFSPDYRYYVYAVYPFDTKTDATWKLLVLDLENGLKTIEDVAKGKILLDKITCNTCQQKTLGLSWTDNYNLKYNLYQDSSLVLCPNIDDQEYKFNLTEQKEVIVSEL